MASWYVSLPREYFVLLIAILRTIFSSESFQRDSLRMRTPMLQLWKRSSVGRNYVFSLLDGIYDALDR